jgi:rhodanese-related sulfurtransferase
MKKIVIILFSFIFSLVCFGQETFEQMAQKMATSFNSPVITYKGLNKLIKSKKVLILDARELDEYKISHIQNATHIGYKDINIRKIIQMLNKEFIVVIYCSVGFRSGDIAARLKRNGIDAYNLYGGLFLWNNIGLPMYTSKQELTKKIHGYNKKWGKWISTGSVVYK